MPMPPAARELVLDAEATLRLADAAAADAAGPTNAAAGHDVEAMPLEPLPALDDTADQRGPRRRV